MPGESIGTVRFGGGNGCGAALFGAPFAAAGGLVMVLAAQGRMEGMPWWGGVLFGLPFLAVGLGLIGGRSVTELDPVRREWRKWWGVFVPFRTSRGSFDDVRAVKIEREVRRNKNSSYTVFPVKMVLEDGQNVSVHVFGDYIPARRAAEKAAKALWVPLHDYTDHRMKVTEPDALDMNIKEKARKGKEKLVVPEEPPSHRSRYEVLGSEVRFTLPPAGALTTVVGALWTVSSIGIVGFFFIKPLTREEMPAPAKTMFLVVLGGFMLVSAAAGVFMIFNGLWGRQVVEVSPAGLTVRKMGLSGWKEDRLAADDVEEVTLKRLGTGGSEITVISDEKILKFGGHLDETEKEWMASVIKVILAS